MTREQADEVFKEAFGSRQPRTLSTEHFARIVEALLVRADADREHIKREVEQVIGPVE
jgi:hypothetical protein